MKRFILFTLTLFSLMIFTASILNAGYRFDPWGSKTWVGPGRPPHWSPEPATERIEKPTGHVKLRDLKAPVGSDKKVYVPHRQGGKGVFWKNKHNLWHNHLRSFDSIYYQKPEVEEVIIEREKRIPVYIQIQREPAKLQCGGDTITRNDPRTGEMIIEYVSGARDC